MNTGQSLSLHPATANLAAQHGAGLGASQAALYGLLVAGFQRLRAGHSSLFPVLCFGSPLGLAVGFGISSLLILIVYGLLRLATYFAAWPMSLFYAFVLVLLALSLGMALFLRYVGGDRIQLKHEDGLARRIHLDRIDDSLGDGAPIGIAGLIGFAFGLQTHGLYFHGDHLGLHIDGTWWECFLLSVNNLFHGMFLGLADLYKLNLAPPVEQSWGAMTLFAAFRVTVDAFLFFLVVALLYRHRVRHLVTSADALTAAPAPDKLIEYLRKACYQNTRWRKTFPEEYVFLCLCEKYLSGKFDECRVLGELFPDLELPTEVRALFVAPDGAALLPQKY